MRYRLTDAIKVHDDTNKKKKTVQFVKNNIKDTGEVLLDINNSTLRTAPN